MPEPKPIADLEAFILQAQSRADPIAKGLVAVANGPSMALLTLYVARAEVMRIAEQHIPPGQWQRFLAEQRKLERAFDERCEVLRAMSRNLSSIAGGRRGNGVG